MAASAQTPPPSAQVVGNAFVQQYYLILQQSPELVYRFYQDGSKLGRPDADGAMVSVTTMEAINEKILSMGYAGAGADIKTVDSQDSLGNGVTVLVTGSLTGVDGIARDFSQSFFLAPQDKGYYVLNDMFRYAEDGGRLHADGGVAYDAEDGGRQHADGGVAYDAALLAEQGLTPSQEQHAPEVQVLLRDGEEVTVEKVDIPVDNGEVSAAEEEAPVAEVVEDVKITSETETAVSEPIPPAAVAVAKPNTLTAVVVAKPSPPAAVAVAAQSQGTTVKEEAPKKSYASIVKVMRDNAAPFTVPTSAPAKPPPTNPERHAIPASRPAVPSEVPVVNSNAGENNFDQEAEVDSHSIYIKNLPLSATSEQLEEEFKKFGPIKPNGIQVRGNKIQGFCFGFVEFDVATAVQSAIEASPIMIGGRPAYVEEKRTTGTRSVPNRGRFAPGRGYGFRNDGVRGRGSFAGRGYGRGDFNNRADFGNRGGGRGGPSSRGGDAGYQRVDHLASNGGRGNSRSVAPRVSASA